MENKIALDSLALAYCLGLLTMCFINWCGRKNREDMRTMSRRDYHGD